MANAKISELPTTQKVGNILDETLKIGGGATTATTPTATIPRETATTNTVEPALRLERTSTGTPANGIGVSQQFFVETAAGNTEIGATIEAVTTDVTAASEDFDLVFKTMAAGAAAAERVRIKSNGTIVGKDATIVAGAPALAQSGDPSQGLTVVDTGVCYQAAGSTNQTWRISSLAYWLLSGAGLSWSSSATNVFTTNDTGLHRKAAGVTENNNGTKGSYTGSAFGSGSQTVAQLPAAATAGAGARSCVTDATATTFLSIVAGGGANIVPVMSNGTNWVIG